MGTTRASTPTSSCWRCVRVRNAGGRGRTRAVRRDLAGGLVALAAACVRLGFWQIERLHQRRAHNARVRAARERPPLELTSVGVPADSARDRRLHARGVFDFGHELVWRARTYEGVPGESVITLLRLRDGSAVLGPRLGAFSRCFSVRDSIVPSSGEW
ncbi:MAG TPA: SURF1 family protein [Gemmatimonadales bacterium]